MGLLGDEWNLLIIRLALLGVRRYNEWYEQLGIAQLGAEPPACEP